MPQAIKPIDTTAFAPASHTHVLDDIGSGTFNIGSNSAFVNARWGDADHYIVSVVDDGNYNQQILGLYANYSQSNYQLRLGPGVGLEFTGDNLGTIRINAGASVTSYTLTLPTSPPTSANMALISAVDGTMSFGGPYAAVTGQVGANRVWYSNGSGALTSDSTFTYNNSNLAVSGSLQAGNNVSTNGGGFWFAQSNLIMGVTTASGDSGNRLRVTDNSGSTLRQISISSVLVRATSTGSDVARITTGGLFAADAAGGGFAVKEGSNCTMGAATLVAGTVTVNTTKVTANSRIFLTGQNSSGTHGELTVSARSAGTSFTITSSSGSDTRSVAWLIVEPL